MYVFGFVIACLCVHVIFCVYFCMTACYVIFPECVAKFLATISICSFPALSPCQNTNVGRTEYISEKSVCLYKTVFSSETRSCIIVGLVDPRSSISLYFIMLHAVPINIE